ncbi:DUF6122 family protein [Polaribacter sp. KT 15]|uniref:DUF6122 family protein n=1 Tax=Polaribacter sp. KT 15 TaxID=1896175 RepID=UPI00090C16CD|nr:DUF6122 family protein [Polaribacter sp. KT 15]SHN03056.1 hypothetical protein SAMN05720268_2251 [Polaribacter sp. KT 15]
MISIKFIVHYSLHFIVPFLFAFVFFRKKWKTVYIIFLLSMLVDLDHLLANPIFQENRCSINFHPLHRFLAMAFYVVGLFFKKTRILCIALLFHMFTDYLDCLL